MDKVVINDQNLVSTMEYKISGLNHIIKTNNSSKKVKRRPRALQIQNFKIGPNDKQFLRLRDILVNK